MRPRPPLFNEKRQVDGLPCRVQAVGLRRKHEVQRVLRAPADASARVLNRTLHSNTQDTLQGGYTFSFRVSWVPSALGADETEAGWPRGGFIAPPLLFPLASADCAVDPRLVLGVAE